MDSENGLIEFCNCHEKICEIEQSKISEFGGNFTTTNIFDGNPALICINCGSCSAVKIQGQFHGLENLLTDESILEDGWRPALTSKHLFIQKLLNFAIYRVNEPPEKDKFECNYSEPVENVDTIYLLWVNRKACGFITLRPCTDAFPDHDFDIGMKSFAKFSLYLIIF
jgi:hypothetical protein